MKKKEIEGWDDEKNYKMLESQEMKGNQNRQDFL